MSLKLWQISALVLAGVLVGILFPYHFTPIFPTVTLYVFLPALIFEGAWQLNGRTMRRAWLPIAVLAFPGVVVTAAIVTGVLYYGAALPISVGLLLGAVLSATDPVAVIAIFRRLPVPTQLATIVESEALLNDGVAVVLYRVILASAVLGITATDVVHIAVQGILAVIGGALIGIVFAYLASLALRARVRAALQIAATFISAYAGYFLADRLGCSGIFAVIALGITLRAIERRHQTVQSARAVTHAWSVAATFANALLFFLVGTALDASVLRSHLAVAGLALLGVIAARAVVSYGGLALIRPRLDTRWLEVIRFAGVRGALSLALALATPPTFPQRAIVIDVTFAVVVLTILIAALTVEPRIRRLRIPIPGESPGA